MDPEIIIIGAGIIDVIACPVTADVFESGSLPAREIRMTTGGDALNEATILARMGKRVQLETVIGKDKAGEFLVDHCRKNQIHIEDHCLRDDLSTGINLVLVTEDGERHFVTNPHGSLRALELSDIQMPFPESAKIICFASVFVFPKIKTKELELLFSQAKKQGKILCADMTTCKNQETLEDMAPAFRYLDYLIPNAKEAMLLTRTETVEEAGQALLAAGVRHVVIKNGKEGCLIFEKDGMKKVASVPSEACIDTTGAGDSFVSGFLAALLENKSVEACAAFGNECGRRAVEVVGATEWI
ncbi:MAG: carbohydrate kinase family protein [Dorea sp.]|nr:carbohydrate kinase family protein [Dorea sp.]